MPTHPRVLLDKLDDLNAWRTAELCVGLSMDIGQIAALVRGDDEMPRFDRMTTEFRPKWQPEYAGHLVVLRAQHVWQQHGANVYSYSGPLARHLLAAARDVPDEWIPPATLGVRPYVNPTLLFPEPVTTPLANGQFGRLFAASVFGVNGILVNDDHPDRKKAAVEFFVGKGTLVGLNEPHEALGICMSHRLPDGTVDNSIMKLAGLGTSDITLGAAVEHSARQMRFSGVMPVPGSDPVVTTRRHVALAARYVLMCLSYALATPLPKPLAKPPRSKPSPGNPTGKGPTPNIYPLDLREEDTP